MANKKKRRLKSVRDGKKRKRDRMVRKKTGRGKNMFQGSCILSAEKRRKIDKEHASINYYSWWDMYTYLQKYRIH